MFRIYLLLSSIATLCAAQQTITAWDQPDTVFTCPTEPTIITAYTSLCPDTLSTGAELTGYTGGLQYFNSPSDFKSSSSEFRFRCTYGISGQPDYQTCDYEAGGGEGPNLVSFPRGACPRLYEARLPQPSPGVQYKRDEPHSFIKRAKQIVPFVCPRTSNRGEYLMFEYAITDPEREEYYCEYYSMQCTYVLRGTNRQVLERGCPVSLCDAIQETSSSIQRRGVSFEARQAIQRRQVKAGSLRKPRSKRSANGM